MEKEENKKLKEVHKMYEQCKKVFTPGFEIVNVGADIEDKEEYEFYKLLHEYFMQKKQRELIKKGVY